MIFFLTTPIGSGHIRGFIERFGREYGRHLVEMTYDEFVRRGEAVGGAYVFTDRNRMSEDYRQIVIDLWNQLESAGAGFRLYNNPKRQLCRYELLKELHRRGWNDFNVFRIEEVGTSKIRYPVFIRLENDHGGPRSELIHDEAQVWKAVGQLVLAGGKLQDLLVTEFIDTSKDMIFRKYGVWRFGPRIIAQHCLLSEHWIVKAEHRIRTDDAIEETDSYFEANPHADLLMPYFEAANIEYGRADFSMLDGKVQLWEINDNPQYFGRNPMRRNRYGKGAVFMSGYRLLDEGLQGTERVRIDVGSSRLQVTPA